MVCSLGLGAKTSPALDNDAEVQTAESGSQGEYITAPTNEHITVLRHRITIQHGRTGGHTRAAVFLPL